MFAASQNSRSNQGSHPGFFEKSKFVSQINSKRPRQESNLEALAGPALKAGALPLCDRGITRKKF